MSNPLWGVSFMTTLLTFGSFTILNFVDEHLV